MLVNRPVKYFAGALFLVSASFAACSSPEGVTPDCNYNVGGHGVYADENGCERFAVCSKGDPIKCCTDAKGKTLTGESLTECLYGYGVIPDAGTGGGGGMGTTTSSGTTSSVTGDAGADGG